MPPPGSSAQFGSAFGGLVALAHSLTSASGAPSAHSQAASRGVGVGAPPAAPTRRRNVDVGKVLDRYFVPADSPRALQRGDRAAGPPLRIVEEVRELLRSAAERHHDGAAANRSGAAAALRTRAVGKAPVPPTVVPAASVPFASGNTPGGNEDRHTNGGQNNNNNSNNRSSGDDTDDYVLPDVHGMVLGYDDASEASAASSQQALGMGVEHSFEPVHAADPELDQSSVAAVADGVKTVTVYRRSCNPDLFHTLGTAGWTPVECAAAADGAEDGGLVLVPPFADGGTEHGWRTCANTA